MNMSVFIEPHEKYEALEAYRDHLSPEQIDEISDAPDGALIRLSFVTGAPTEVLIIEEG